MDIQDLRTTLTAESKKRTAAYFDNLPPVASDRSEKAKALAQAIIDGKFGCATDGVVRLVSLLLGEDVAPLVKPRDRPQPGLGVIIVFLSSNVAPGQWVPTLKVKPETHGFLHNIKDGDFFALNGEQFNAARRPTDGEINVFFNKMSLANLRAVVSSGFGLDALVPQ